MNSCHNIQFTLNFYVSVGILLNKTVNVWKHNYSDKSETQLYEIAICKEKRVGTFTVETLHILVCLLDTDMNKLANLIFTCILEI